MVPHPFRDLRSMYASHPDHQAVGEAALCAVYPDARNPFAFPELRERESLAAWTVREVWIAGGPDSNHYVDVTVTSMMSVKSPSRAMRAAVSDSRTSGSATSRTIHHDRPPSDRMHSATSTASFWACSKAGKIALWAKCPCPTTA